MGRLADFLPRVDQSRGDHGRSADGRGPGGRWSAGATPAKPTAPGMPAFAWKLSDEEIASVATYVRNAWGNRAAPVPREKVAKLRRRTGTVSAIKRHMTGYWNDHVNWRHSGGEVRGSAGRRYAQRPGIWSKGEGTG